MFYRNTYYCVFGVIKSHQNTEQNHQDNKRESSSSLMKRPISINSFQVEPSSTRMKALNSKEEDLEEKESNILLNLQQ